jgi:hypothetical protein
MLAHAVTDPTASSQAIVELRAFLVAALEHHHMSEDHDLWPILTAAAPPLAGALDRLSLEHERLDAALEELSAAPIVEGGDGRLAQAAARVRDLVHDHLSHEEPVLLPALEAHVADDVWSAFSQRVVDANPPIGTDLLVWFLYDVAAATDVDLIVRHLPPEARELVPAMREQGGATLATLHATARTTDR